MVSCGFLRSRHTTTRLTWVIAWTVAIVLVAGGGSLSEGEKRYNAGMEFQDQGLLERAIAEYDEAIKLEPRDANAYVDRGIAYGSLGQAQRAIEDFNEAVKLDPQATDAHYNRGVAYISLKTQLMISTKPSDSTLSPP